MESVIFENLEIRTLFGMYNLVVWAAVH